MLPLPAKFKTDCLALILLTLVGLIFIRFFFLPTFPSTHDGQNHLARLANLDLAFRDRHFPFRWATNLNHGFGYPVFNFNYYLPEFLSLTISKADFSFEASLKIMIAAAYIFGSLFWYLFLRQYFKFLASFCGGLFSLSAIYPLVIIWVRGSPGETLALALFPLILLLIKLFQTKPNRLNFFLVTICLFLFLLTHNLTVLFGLPILFVFSLLNCRSWRITLAPFILSLGLSLFFWLPVVLEKQFTYLKYFDSTGYLAHFPSFWQLIYSQWGFGYSVPGTNDGFSFQLGPFHWLAVIVSLIYLKKKTLIKRTWLFFALIFLVYLFLTLPISAFIYRWLPFLNFIQYPWRLLLFLTLSSIWLAAFVVQQKPKLGLFLSLSAVVYALIIAKPQGGFNWPNHYYYLFPFTSTVGQEAMPIWFDEAKNSRLFDSSDKVVGAVNFNLNLWKTQTHVYEVTVDKDTVVFEKTAYFPGWELTVDGKPSAIIYDNQDYPGLIGFHLTAGTHTIETTFTEHTSARQWGDKLSLVSLSLLTFTLIFFPKLSKKIKIKYAKK